MDEIDDKVIHHFFISFLPVFLIIYHGGIGLIGRSYSNTYQIVSPPSKFVNGYVIWNLYKGFVKDFPPLHIYV